MSIPAGFESKTLTAKLLHAAEECAEVAQAIVKTLRIAARKQIPVDEALWSFHPGDPKSTINRDRIRTEASQAVAALRLLLGDQAMTPGVCRSGNVSCGNHPADTFRCAECKELVCYCQGIYYESVDVPGDPRENEICNSCSVLNPKTRKRSTSHGKKTTRSVVKKIQTPRAQGAQAGRGPHRQRDEKRGQRGGKKVHRAASKPRSR